MGELSRKEANSRSQGINFAVSSTRSFASHLYNLLLRMPAQMYRWFSTSATALSKAVALKSERRFNLYRSLNSPHSGLYDCFTQWTGYSCRSRIIVYLHTACVYNALRTWIQWTRHEQDQSFIHHRFSTVFGRQFRKIWKSQTNVRHSRENTTDFSFFDGAFIVGP